MSVVGGNPRCKWEKRDSDARPGLGGLGWMAVDRQAFGDGERWSGYGPVSAGGLVVFLS